MNALILSEKGCYLPIQIRFWASKIDTKNCLQYSTRDGSQLRTIQVLAYTLEQYTPPIKNFSSERLSKWKTYLSSSTSISRSLSFSRLNSRCSIFLQSGWRYLKVLHFLVSSHSDIAAITASLRGFRWEKRRQQFFFLGLCGRLAFAASIARFRAVLLENASRTSLGEGTGTL